MKVKKIKGKGRGVIAEFDYTVGDVVEVCPVVVLSNKEFHTVNKTILGDYVFSWPGVDQSPRSSMDKWKRACICLGLGSLYNHDPEANLCWRIRFHTMEIVFFAVKEIKAGDELTHDYTWPEEKYSALGVR